MFKSDNSDGQLRYLGSSLCANVLEIRSLEKEEREKILFSICNVEQKIPWIYIAVKFNQYEKNSLKMI